MKLRLVLLLGLVLAVVLTEVHCHRRRSQKRRRHRSTVRPTPRFTGWRVGNGSCICRGHHHSTPTRPSHGLHPTGHRPSGHHGPHPTGHHRPSGHHRTHPTGHRPSGHHGPHPPGHGPSGHQGPHPTRHRPSGHHGPHPTGHRPSGPIKRCKCRRRAERKLKLKFRMKKKWDDSYADETSKGYKAMTEMLSAKFVKVFRGLIRFIEKMRLRRGSIIVEFAVMYNKPDDGSPSEDPEELLREGMKGELKDLNIYPESLVMNESYSGVTLTDWKTSTHDCIFTCHKYSDKLVQQTRTCAEVDASCDGIPLTREVCCEKACATGKAKHHGFKKASKVLLIACVSVAVVVIIAVIVILMKAKKSQHKYISTSPSTSSLKQLASNDKLEKPKC